MNEGVGSGCQSSGLARPWLVVAAGLVGTSAVFALLVALARVPALGALFPGDDFYRSALTMHVSYSQGGWFAACACALLAACGSNAAKRGALAASRMGAAAMAVAALGMLASLLESPEPIMSNYFPVLDSALFLASSGLIVVVLLAVTTCFLIGSGARPDDQLHIRCARTALRLFAIQVWIAALLGFEAWLSTSSSSRLESFEAIFWGAGHAWQYALVSLMMATWVLQAESAVVARIERVWLAIMVLAAAPTALSVLALVQHETGSAAQYLAQTDAMRFASWPAPIVFFLWLGLRSARLRSDPGFVGTLLLFVCGVWLGARIDGENTLVTAHYHGTVGAVSLSLMWWAANETSAGAPVHGFPPRTGALLYAGGIGLMMVGLAGAGWSGAPRKMPGDLSLTASIETMSRFGLGVGGLLATLGLVWFAWGIIGNDGRKRHGRARIRV